MLDPEIPDKNSNNSWNGLPCPNCNNASLEHWGYDIRLDKEDARCPKCGYSTAYGPPDNSAAV